MEQLVINTVLRSIAAYLLLLILIRMMGKKQVSQMTFFNFTVGITIGAVASTLSLGEKPTPLSAAIVMVTLTFLTSITALFHIKSIKLRKILNSEPVVMVENGVIVDKNLKKNRLTVDELTMMLREKNLFNIADVEFAVMETDGKFSVLPKAAKQPVTPSDLDLPVEYKGLTKDLIMDGKILNENLYSTNKDSKWLREQLKLKGINGAKDVFYAGIDASGNLYVSLKSKEKEEENHSGIE